MTLDQDIKEWAEALKTTEEEVASCLQEMDELHDKYWGDGCKYSSFIGGDDFWRLTEVYPTKLGIILYLNHEPPQGAKLPEETDSGRKIKYEPLYQVKLLARR